MRSVLESFVSAAPRASSKTVACRRVVMQAHDGGPMRTLFLLLLAPLLIASLAQADPDDLSGGVLLVHAPPSLTYTASASWCDSTHLDDCEDQVTSIPTDSSKTVVWFILSAWAEEKSFTAVEFGLGDFDEESFLFSESGLCLDHAMALYHGDWPGPNTGVAIATNTEPWMGQLVPIFWAAGVNYAAADTIAITENPATEHAGWVSESRESFDAECLGALGLGEPGTNCWPVVQAGDLDGLDAEGGELVDGTSDSNCIIVMFVRDSMVRLRDGRLVDLTTNALDGISEILADMDGYEWERIDLPEPVLDSLFESASSKTTAPLRNFNDCYRLHFNGSADSRALADRLAALPGVDYAYPNPSPEDLALPCNPGVPNWELIPAPGYDPNNYQWILYPAGSPHKGMDFFYSWTRSGGTGEDVTICDVEFAWNYDHYDVSKLIGSQIMPGTVEDDFEWRSHGTMAAGTCAADRNGIGVTGLAYGASLRTAGIYYGDPLVTHVVDAILAACAVLQEGDVLLLELGMNYEEIQCGPNCFDFTSLPLEWLGTDYPDIVQHDNAYRQAIMTAVALGIHVVEPAGNGGYNLDEFTWLEDSGAIIAGRSAQLHTCVDTNMENYGTRVHSYGSCEVTTGGSGYHCYGAEDEDCHFWCSPDGGTSQGAAVIASAIACIEGYLKANRPHFDDSPQSLRNLIVATGSPVSDPPYMTGCTYKRPNLRGAIESVGSTTFVSSDGSGDYLTIGDALNAAVDGWTINVADGTYAEANLSYEGKSVIVRSSSGDPHACRVVCQGDNPAFTFGEEDGPEAVLDGFTITGFRCDDDCMGAIASLGASPTIRNCVFEDNRQFGSEPGGPAVYCEGGAPHFANCVFRDNVSQSGAGGAVHASDAMLEFHACSFQENYSGNYGGGVCADGGTMLMNGCRFDENYASLGGGGAYLAECVTVAIDTCVFFGNVASAGGALHCWGNAETAVRHSSFAGNQGQLGAGLYCVGADVDVDRSIIAHSAYGSAVYGSASINIRCTDIFGNAGGDWVGPIAGQCGQNGNLCGDPMFCDLAGGVLTIHAESPCRSYRTEGCGMVGALPIGCPAAGIESGECLLSGQGEQLTITPNPAAGNGVIAGRGMKGQKVELQIVDVSGRVLRRLYGESGLGNGRWEVQWDCRDDRGVVVPGGVYYVRMVNVGGARRLIYLR